MKNARTLIAAAILSMTGVALAAAPAANLNWMSPDVPIAWSAGYTGKGVTITVVDDHSTKSGLFQGRMANDKKVFNTHGQWTTLEASLVAPDATIKTVQFASAAPLALGNGLNVVNASYGMVGRAGFALNQIAMGGVEKSMIAAADGKAVIVKSAGNDYVAINTKTAAGNQDYLNLALTGKSSVIFAGALESNGTVANKARMASYSNTAGTNKAVQDHFLMVGVVRSYTALGGTSFAAPVISGYAAIVGSKFTGASANAVTNQLLTTARTDTIVNYNAALHGRGEVSLSRALSPVAIK